MWYDGFYDIILSEIISDRKLVVNVFVKGPYTTCNKDNLNTIKNVRYCETSMHKCTFHFICTNVDNRNFIFCLVRRHIRVHTAIGVM